jgi:hypothetical protein
MLFKVSGSFTWDIILYSTSGGSLGKGARPSELIGFMFVYAPNIKKGVYVKAHAES